MFFPHSAGHDAAEKFLRDGVLVLRRAADPALCDALYALGIQELAREADPLETEADFLGVDRPAYRKTIRRLRQIHQRADRFRAWMQTPAIRPLLADLLGEPPVLITAHHNSLMTKMPRTSTETRWHRDRRYWHYRDDRLISVWLALGEERESNGALEFIPGSHRQEFPREAFDSLDYFREDLPANRRWLERRIRFDLNRGDVVLFHASLLHRAGPNLSDRPKLSVVYTVRAQSNLPIPGSRSAAFEEIPLPLPDVRGSRR